MATCSPSGEDAHRRGVARWRGPPAATHLPLHHSVTAAGEEEAEQRRRGESGREAVAGRRNELGFCSPGEICTIYTCGRGAPSHPMQRDGED